MSEDRATHWEDVYTSKAVDDVSWFQKEPARSLTAITAVADTSSSVVDVGSGASLLVDRLLAAGYHDVTLVDISARALAEVRSRLGAGADRVTFTCSDLLEWQPGRLFDVWHDRAVFHFLTDPDDRERYVQLVCSSVPQGGHLVVSTFAPDGPTHCSGLEVARYHAETLAAQFAPGFAVVSADHEEHRTPWDAVQSFTWVTLRRI